MSLRIVKPFDRFRDLVATYKAGAMIRGAADLRWTCSATLLRALRIVPALRAEEIRGELLDALYTGKVGVKVVSDPAGVTERLVVDTDEGEPIALLVLPQDFRLP